VYATVTLTNTGTTSCTLHGWPILTLQDKLGAVLTSALVDVPRPETVFSFWRVPRRVSPAKPTTRHDADPRKERHRDLRPGVLGRAGGHRGVRKCDIVFVQFAKNGTPVSLTPSEPVQPCSNGRSGSARSTRALVVEPNENATSGRAATNVLEGAAEIVQRYLTVNKL